MTSKLRKRILAALKIVLPIGIIWLLVSWITPEQWDVLRSSPKNYSYLAIALILGLVATVTSYVRWGLLVRSHGISLTSLEAIRLSAIGFLLNFVSAGAVGGDIFKAFFLAKRSPGKRIEAFASVLVDRIIGLYGLLIVSSVALLWAGQALDGTEASLVRAVILGSTAIGAIVMMGILLGGQAIDAALDKLARVSYVGPFIHRVADPLRAFRDHTGTFMLAIVMAVTTHCIMAFVIHFIAAGLYPTPPSIVEQLIAVPLANAFAALPVAPGGVGVFEAALQYLYESFPDVPAEVSGTVVGLVFEVVKILIAAIGILFYWTGGKEIRDSLSAAQTDEPQD